MSYQSKKRKKSKLNRLYFYIGLVFGKFFNKTKKLRRERKVRLPGTKKTMDLLRMKNRAVRTNNLKINEWVDEYLNSCLVNGEPVNVLTPWCLSKALERRFQIQGNDFAPTKREMRVLGEEIPEIIRIFKENGFRLNWWITFSRSYLDDRLLCRATEDAYKKMVADLAERSSLGNDVLFLNWEDDILGCRAAPDKRILKDFDRYIKKGVFEIEFERWRNWAKEEAGLNPSDEELVRDTKYQIACESCEGEFLMGGGSPFPSGNFILAPLETPERFDNFTVFAPEFKKRVVSVLPLYPWRLA